MQSVDAEVDSRALTGLDNLVVYLLLHLLHNLLNTCRMDTTVSNKLVEGKTANLAANRVKGTDDDSFRSVVNYDFHSCGSLQCTYITSLATDNASLNLIVVNVEHTDTVLYGSLCCHALYGLYDNLAGVGVGIELGLVHDLVDIALRVGLCLVLHRLNQSLLCLLGTQSGEFLEFLALLELHLLQFLLLDDQQFLLIVDTHLLVIQLVLAASQFLLALIE